MKIFRMDTSLDYILLTETCLERLFWGEKSLLHNNLQSSIFRVVLSEVTNSYQRHYEDKLTLGRFLSWTITVIDVMRRSMIWVGFLGVKNPYKIILKHFFWLLSMGRKCSKDIVRSNIFGMRWKIPKLTLWEESLGFCFFEMSYAYRQQYKVKTIWGPFPGLKCCCRSHSEMCFAYRLLAGWWELGICVKPTYEQRYFSEVK